MNKLLLILGAGVLFFISKKDNSQENASKRAVVIDRLQRENAPVQMLNNLTPEEVNVFYRFYIDFQDKNLQPPSSLVTQMQSILMKYGVNPT